MKFDLKKSLACAIILLLLLIVTMPSINAVTTQISINKNDEKSCFYGGVYGAVTTSGFPPYTEISGAKLVLEGGLINKITFSGVWGFYRFNFVEVGRQYTLTVSHPHYKTEFETFTLSPVDPIKIISFRLTEKDTSKTKTEQPACFGTILGKTGAYMWSGWCPIHFVKVTIGTRTKYSNPHFFFTGLPLAQTYTVTASKLGWKTDTREITLTKENPIANIQFDLDDNGYNIVKTTTQNQKITQPVLTKSEKPTCLGSIYGNAGTSYGWGFSSVGLVKIEAGGRTTYSSPIMGTYKIKYLPLGTYTITGSKIGYDAFTDTVSLTKDRPDKQVFIHMEPNDKSVNKAKTPATAEKIENEDITGKYGRVSGMVHTGGFPPYTEISGAMLVLEGDLIKRITFSGILGFYRFNFLTIGKTYVLTVSHPQYKTQTETFTITADKPHIFINFEMYEKNTRNTESEEPAGLGSIWGNTGELYIWGFSPVGLVKVEAGGKTTYSSPIMGFYKIRNLPLGTYTVTGTKRGYDTRTETVKLTEEHPNQQCFIHMEPNDKSVNKAII